MNAVVKVVENEWADLDKAHARMETSMLEWCVAVSQMEDKQVEIAARYFIDKGAVNKMVKVGKNASKMLINDQLLPNLPTGYNQLVELVDLPKSEIKKLCKDKVPTRAVIKAKKMDLGLLPPPPVKPDIDNKTVGDPLTDALKRLPPSALDGVSELGLKLMEKRRRKILKMLELVPTLKIQDQLMTILCQVYGWHETPVKQMAKQIAKKELADRAKALDEREKKVAARERKSVTRLTDKERKTVQMVLHPDRAPEGMTAKYKRAWDVFNKIA